DFRPISGALAVILTVEHMGPDLGAEVASIASQHLVVERLRTADELARHAAAGPSLTEPVLHGLDLQLVPVGPEGAQDSAVMSHVAVPIRSALPDANGGEMRWPKRRHLPLVDAVV